MINNQEGLCLALLSTILVIVFFSPNYKDCFTNQEFPEKMEHSLHASFPFYNPKKLKEQISARDVGIKNYDGSMSNGYQPSIIRPNAYTGHKKYTVDGTPCSWPCYSGSKDQNWCKESDAINYFAMRPLVTPKNYNGWLTTLFNEIIVPGNNVSKILDSKILSRASRTFSNHSCTEILNGRRRSF